MEEKKRCPYCGEEILAVAKKCKHCGEWLEQKDTQKISCPVCGEKIEADAKVCPIWHETIEDTSQPIKLQYVNTPAGTKESDNGFLYCKSCKQRLSVDAPSCPHCGETDPFRFEEIKKIEKKSHIGCWGFVGLCIIVEIIFNCFGIHEGILNWLNYFKWPQMLCLAIVWLIVVGISKYFMKQEIDKIATDMATIFVDKNTKDAMYTWWLHVRTIVGELWFPIIWSKG